MAFRVLMVCTANHCRSPLAEHVLRSRAPGWTVTSAGTQAMQGQPMHPTVAALLAERGIATQGWLGTQLTEARIQDTDLILTATREHRQRVVTLEPTAVQRTFTLLEFAALAAHADPLQGSLLDAVVAARGQRQPQPPGAEDLADPIGLPAEAFRDCLQTIDRAVGDLLRAY